MIAYFAWSLKEKDSQILFFVFNILVWRSVVHFAHKNIDQR